MNHKLKQLKDQARMQAREEHGYAAGALLPDEWVDEKFSLLIVKECAYTAAMFSIENKRIHPDIDPQTMPSASRMIYHSTCQSVAREIIEHFGVEE
jgi:hypothetical protein